MKSCLLLVIAFADPSYFHLQQSNLCSCVNPVFSIFSMSLECFVQFLAFADKSINSINHFLEDTQQGCLSSVVGFDLKLAAILQYSSR